MSTTIAAVESNKQLKTAEFVEIVIPQSINYAVQPPTINISSAYKRETIQLPDSRVLTFTPAGGLLSLGDQHRDLQASSFDTTIALDGIAYDNVYNVLEYEVRGAKVNVWRGFYNDDLTLGSIAKRFSGVVVSYLITENADPKNKYYTVVLNVSSYKTIMANNIGGRRTNADDWARTSPDDLSMSNVANLNGASFNFGMPA